MNKIILVTGGTSGIGNAICTFLHHKGYTVYGTGRDLKQISGFPFSLIKMDVRNPQSIQDAIAEIIQKSKRIDIVINNAGIGITGPLEEIPLEEMKNNFDTNLFGPIEVIKAVLPQMRLQQSGLIINITSIAGYMGLPYRSIYSASKGALELVTEALRMEVAPFGIRVTNIAPGDFATNIASRRYHVPLEEKSAYRKSYDHILYMINKHVDKGSNPDDMAKVVYKLIQTSQPKIHYKVGSFLQKFSIVLKRILPDIIYEKMLIKHYKL